MRKSVVRILRGVLLWRSPHSLHTQICRALVYRAALVREEDTIRDLIRDTFQVPLYTYANLFQRHMLRPGGVVVQLNSPG